MTKLTYDQVKTLVANNNKADNFSNELVLSVAWKESSFDETAVQPYPNSATGLLQITKGAVADANANTPNGVHFEHSEMSTGSKNIQCGTYYLDILFDRFGSVKTALEHYGTGDGYADNLLTCESCLKSGPADPMTCLKAIHSFEEYSALTWQRIAEEEPLTNEALKYQNEILQQMKLCADVSTKTLEMRSLDAQARDFVETVLTDWYLRLANSSRAHLRQVDSAAKGTKALLVSSKADRVVKAKALLSAGDVYPRGCSEFVCSVLGIPYRQANDLMGNNPPSVGNGPIYNALEPGDIAGWIAVTGSGHVAVYIGEGGDNQFIDVREPGAEPRSKNGYYNHEMFKAPF
ncbi:MAG TPA: transglycosylase SLT domain-containing protein [Dongiaceae bacterium]|nr:transglycosylase SLT domain-containing protein [Dongiaceae bacterium]